MSKLAPATKLFAAAALALGATGAALVAQSNEGESEPADDFSPVAVADPVESFDELPLASLSAPDQERRRRINDGIQALAAECMEAEGFPYEPLGFDASPTRNRYGIVDLEVAETYGYQDPGATQATGDGLPDASDEYVYALVGNQDEGGHSVKATSPSGAVLASYFRDGCLWEAEQAIWGDWGAYEGARILLQNVDISAHARASETPEVAAAMRRWSDCMADAGFEVRDLDDLQDRLLPELSDGSREGQPSDDEVALAEVDAKCNLSAGVEATWYEADIEAQAEMLQRSEVSAAQFEAMLVAADERAAGVGR